MPAKPRGDYPHAIAEERIQTALSQQLQNLDLRELGLTSLPEWLGQLTRLQSIDLSRNQLTSLPESLGELTGLQNLYLSGNQLTSLPESLGELINLKYLGLYNNQLTNLPESLGHLKRLQNLDVSGNRLISLPESLGQLASLEFLNLCGNQLTSLPKSLDELTSLRRVFFRDNQLTSLPESLGQLTSLESLDLSGNQLTSLPIEIRELRALTHLSLHYNPALGLPKEVLNPASPDAILDYYFRIHPPERKAKPAGKVLRELKVIFVGRGGVGKTSLIEVLKGGEFVEGRKKTEGIAITRWPLTLPDGAATALVWDFGGQEIMHGTHQFFLTHRSLYIVVLDALLERHDRSKEDGEYWLKIVRAFGGQSPVLVVLNAQRRCPFDTDREYLATKYDIAREHFFRTDCADEKSVVRLRKAIEHEAARTLSTPELFPAEWWAVKERLGAMKERGENYLSEEGYENLSTRLQVEENDSEVLLRRLAELGTVLSFPDPDLRELAVLNPEWVTDGIYRVLNDLPLKEQRHGQLTWDELKRILPSDRWPRKCYRYLVALMRKFELCFSLEGESETELVPELLPDKTPALDDWKPAECLVFLYQYPVLVHGVFPRFITRTHSKSRGRERWRSGVVLARGDAEAVVRADYDKNQVIVWVRGRYADARRDLLTVVRDDFSVIHGRIKGLNPQEMVAVKGYPEVTEPFDDLLQDERDGVRTTRLTIDGKRVEVEIAELLNGVESPEDRAKRAKEEERIGGVKTIVYDQRIMGDQTYQNISGGTFHGPVATVMRECTNIISNQPPGERKDLLETLHKQVGELISGPSGRRNNLRR